MGLTKIVPAKTVLVRYNSNGSLDTTFGTGGIVEEPTEAASPAALAQLSNGSYLVVGGARTFIGGIQLHGSAAVHSNAGNIGCG